ncbi:MAG: hypothetical protein J0M29_14960 [Chitinophagales bacterium]|nr:hypothetical protein [Chitinophagales bacterium]
MIIEKRIELMNIQQVKYYKKITKRNNGKKRLKPQVEILIQLTPKFHQSPFVRIKNLMQFIAPLGLEGKTNGHQAVASWKKLVWEKRFK